MAQTAQRAFALSGAILFLITGSALTIAVVISLASGKKNDNPSAAAQTCDIRQTTGTASTLPEVFKPEGDVTKLATTDLADGSGAAVKSGDCLQVKYFGTLATDGTVFDQDFDKAETLQLKLGAGQVIKGWDEGLVGMKPGGVRRIVIPSELAYGANAQSAIPANSDLVFVVKLEKVVK